MFKMRSNVPKLAKVKVGDASLYFEYSKVPQNLGSYLSEIAFEKRLQIMPSKICINNQFFEPEEVMFFVKNADGSISGVGDFGSPIDVKDAAVIKAIMYNVPGPISSLRRAGENLAQRTDLAKFAKKFANKD